jgi:hypothetical protein
MDESGTRIGGRLPTFIIAGTPRSGTSSLNHYLRQHPQVFMAPGKELRFFNVHYDRGVTWYASCFEGSSGALAVGEATPTYIYDAVALERMASLLPTVKLIVSLRDPVSRTYSAYLNARQRGREPRSFEDLVEHELTLPAEDRQYLGRSYYSRHLRRLKETMPEAELHVLVMEQMVEEPERTFRATCRFLDVDPGFRPLDLGRVINPYVEFRSMSLRRIAKRSQSRTVRRAIDRMNTRNVDFAPLDPRIRSRLVEHYRDEGAAISGYLGFDVDRWWS